MLPTSSLFIPPFLVAAIAGWMNSNGWPKQANAIISLVVIAAISTIWALFSGKLVGNDLWTNIIFIAGVCAAFVAGPLQPLQQWFTAKTTSPLTIIAMALSPWRHSIATQPMPPVTPSRSSPYYQGAQIMPRRTTLYTYTDPDDGADRHDTSAVIPAMTPAPAAPTGDDPSATTTTPEEPPAA